MLINEIWVGFLNDCFIFKMFLIIVVMKNNCWMFEFYGFNRKYGNMLFY